MTSTAITAPAPLERDAAGRLFGQTMGLVALTAAVFALGAYIGRDLSELWAICAFVFSFAVLFGMNAAAQRSEQLALGLLFAFGLLLGLAVAPAVAHYIGADPRSVWLAGGATALFIAGFGAAGYATRSSLSPHPINRPPRTCSACSSRRRRKAAPRARKYLQRAYQRQEDRDAPTDLATRDAQLAAITAWGIPDASRLNRLAGITQPTLVANGDDDRMLHTENSRLLAEQLPNAELQIYPDANHGFLDQYPELFADDIVEFLNR